MFLFGHTDSHLCSAYEREREIEHQEEDNCFWGYILYILYKGIFARFSSSWGFPRINIVYILWLCFYQWFWICCCYDFELNTNESSRAYEILKPLHTLAIKLALLQLHMLMWVSPLLLMMGTIFLSVSSQGFQHGK